MEELKIIATIEVKADFKNMVLEALHEVVDSSRLEKGNLSYELHQDVKNPLKFIIVEVWKSETAIDEHNNSIHFKKFVHSIEDKIVSLTIDVVKKIY